MKRTILLITLAGLLVCISNSTIVYAQSESKDLTIFFPIKKWEDSLTKYQNRLKKLETSTNFRVLYNDLGNYKLAISKEIDSLLVKNKLDSSLKKFFQLKFPFLRYTIAEEGTPVFLIYNNEELLKYALKTKGKEDDTFINLMEDIYGLDSEPSDYSNPIWVHKRTSISRSSKLGDLSTFLIYKRIVRENKKNKLFRKEYSKILQDIQKDIVGFGAFDYSKEKVTEELNKIRRFDTSLHNRIVEYLKVIDNYPSTYRFDCNTNDCGFE